MKKYNHVAVIGIDGMGNFNRLTDTPCMDRIFSGGASTFFAYSLDPTISAENWGGMLIGADPAVHNLTNGYISCHPYENEKLPGVFRRIRERFPDAYLASVVNWNPINIGIVEDGIGVDKRTDENDEKVTERVIECVKNKPLFLFVQLDNVDGAGHTFGYGSEGHLKKISEIDALVGRIFDEYEKQGIAEDTLFICIADHGGNDRGHGGWSEGEKFVFFAVAGRRVKNGEIDFAVTKDIAAVVLYALGIEIPEYNPAGFSSQIPSGLFENYEGKYIKPEIKPAPCRKAGEPFRSKSGFSGLFGDRIKACMFFESSVKDETGFCGVSQTGLVKYYSNGVTGSAAEFGATGSIKIDGFEFSKSFSLAFWIKADPDIPGSICIAGNRPLEGGGAESDGFNILLNNHSVSVRIRSGDDEDSSVTSFGADGCSGFIHIAVAFDYDNSSLMTFVNFASPHVDKKEKMFFDSVARGGDFVLGDDRPVGYNHTRNLIFRMDDFILVDGAFDSEDIKKLCEYYGMNQN